MSYRDRSLVCAECGSTFTFSADDQAYHASRGFTNEPRRCPTCRANRRAERGSGGSYSTGGSYAQRELTTVTCSQCGQEAQVPFVPRGDRPVYCSDCYSQQRGSSGGGSSGYSDSSYGGGRGSGRGSRGGRW